MSAFWISLGMTFWAEMGDKTQLVALAYATRYSVRDVLLGILWATAAVHLLSVGIGRFIATWLPMAYVQGLSALCFLGFGIWTLLGDKHDGPVRESHRHPILLVGIVFFLAELGDKTMLAAVTLATRWPWVPVWLGTTAGMVLADGLAVGIGRWAGQRIPERQVRIFAAILFFGFALWSGVEAWRSWHLSPAQTPLNALR
jgi:Ca2+/H+ antiporter, TMEM165/GDT1 family